MDKAKQDTEDFVIPVRSVTSGRGFSVTRDIYMFTQQVVNVVFLGDPDEGHWILVDAGMPSGGREIIGKAKKRFGERQPSAIILTHGHFDHVGGISVLLKNGMCLYLRIGWNFRFCRVVRLIRKLIAPLKEDFLRRSLHSIVADQ